MLPIELFFHIKSCFPLWLFASSSSAPQKTRKRYNRKTVTEMNHFPAEELNLELLEIHLVRIDTMLQWGDLPGPRKYGSATADYRFCGTGIQTKLLWYKGCTSRSLRWLHCSTTANSTFGGEAVSSARLWDVFHNLDLSQKKCIFLF